VTIIFSRRPLLYEVTCVPSENTFIVELAYFYLKSSKVHPSGGKSKLMQQKKTKEMQRKTQTGRKSAITSSKSKRQKST
jgi:hypothetical protein